MTEVNIQAEPCNCDEGKCEELIDPEKCVNRMARNHTIQTLWCERFLAYTWHKDGKCMKCALFEMLGE